MKAQDITSKATLAIGENEKSFIIKGEIKDNKLLMLPIYGLKGAFTKIIYELNERWEEAKEIKDIPERLDAYRKIFKDQDKVVDLLRPTINAIRRAR